MRFDKLGRGDTKGAPKSADEMALVGQANRRRRLCSTHTGQKQALGGFHGGLRPIWMAPD